MPTSKRVAPRFFRSAAQFRAWLKNHGRDEKELVVGFHKVGSGKPSMTWPESVDEALCFGWIDGVRTRIDADSYKIRFSPRKKDSIWSSINIAKAERLIAEGRMRPEGREAYARRVERNSTVYSYEQRGALALVAADERQFKRNKVAWAYFQGAAPSYRKTCLHWVASARQEATRQRRLLRLIEACSRKTRLL